ncbi:MAG TPA: mannonate dehydratase [Rhodobacteraceae bacterium]|nr:mannonate dehydratase [Paracoccaceae bacterium]
MKQTWRWYGPDDPVSLGDAKQAGVQGIVTALHQITPGDVWPVNEIKNRQVEIARLPSGNASGMTWDVVESVFISDDIKAQSGDWRAQLDNYKQSLRNLATCGVNVVAYHTMPVLDWTRTDLKWQHQNTGLALRFDQAELAAFDIHILGRKGAGQDYPEDVVDATAKLIREKDDAWKATLVCTLTAGLPGSGEGWTLDEFRDRLALWNGVSPQQVFANHVDFLSEVVPLAQELGLRFACHPDDPPFPILGLPRIMSTEADFQAMFDAVDLPANGMTFCTGSLGARGDNDLVGMARRLGPRIHFAHLRNVRRESETVPCSFFEDDHMTGSSNMVRIIEALLREEARRCAAGEMICQIPMRPDHGHELMTDINAGGNPGYSAIGRLRGLAELRGAMLAIKECVI